MLLYKEMEVYEFKREKLQTEIYKENILFERWRILDTPE